MEQIKQKLFYETKDKIQWKDFLKAGLCLIASTAIGFVFYKMGFNDTNIITVYILDVMISAVMTQSRVLSFVQSLMSVLVFNYCFTKPRFSLDINQMLQNQKSVSGIGETMAEELNKILNRLIVYYEKDKTGLKKPKIYDINNTLNPDGKRKMLMDNAACYYLAVRSLDEVYGVVGIRLNQEENLSAFESNVLMAVLSESATVMERELLRKKEEM